MSRLYVGKETNYKVLDKKELVMDMLQNLIKLNQICNREQKKCTVYVRYEAR